jgi:hypothetical protein
MHQGDEYLLCFLGWPLPRSSWFPSCLGGVLWDQWWEPFLHLLGGRPFFGDPTLVLSVTAQHHHMTEPFGANVLLDSSMILVDKMVAYFVF